MVRTLVEIRNGRVSIQETADETTVTVSLDGAMSDDGLLSNAQVRSDIAQAAMKRNLESQVAELRDLLAGSDSALGTAADDLARSRALVQGERQRVADLEHDLNTVRESEAELRRSLEARNNLLAGATAQLGKVSGAVHGPTILAALDQVARNPEQADTLANAVREVRRLVGSPGLGTTGA